MSVNALDRPVPQSTPDREATPKSSQNAKDTTANARDGQKSERISFKSAENPSGRLFADPGAMSKGSSNSNALHNANRQALDGQGPDLFTQMREKVKGWCGGQRPPKPCPPPPKPDPCYGKPPKPCPPPPKPDPCYGKPPERPTPCKPDPCYGKPPERPTPCKPDPCYGKPDPWYGNKSNDDLARSLLNNFDAFRAANGPSYITTQNLADMANRELTGNPTQDANIRLARELMRRPELVNAIDRHSTTGALDGFIDRLKIQMTLNSQSPMKYKDDNQLAAEMLDHFKALRDPRYPDHISIEKLRNIAEWPTDGAHGDLAWIAQEILKRSDTLAQMDGSNGDGWIHKDTLRRMMAH